jgi:hypothetical protein
LIDVLYDGGESEHAVAIGEWNGVRRLAMRWNGTEERPAGNPQSRGNATWFVLPPEIYDAGIIDKLPTNKQAIAKALLGRS